MTTTWNPKSKSSGTSWTQAPTQYTGYIPYDSVYKYDSTLTYDGAVNTFTNIPKASVTSWTNKPKAT